MITTDTLLNDLEKGPLQAMANNALDMIVEALELANEPATPARVTAVIDEGFAPVAVEAVNARLESVGDTRERATTVEQARALYRQHSNTHARSYVIESLLRYSEHDRTHMEMVLVPARALLSEYAEQHPEAHLQSRKAP